MSVQLSVKFASLTEKTLSQKRDRLLVLCGSDRTFGKALTHYLAPVKPILDKVAEINEFKGEKAGIVVLPAPDLGELKHIALIGVGEKPVETKLGWMQLGGQVAAKLNTRVKAKIGVAIDPGETKMNADAIAAFVAGFELRFYQFDKYKTDKHLKNTDETQPEKSSKKVKLDITFLVVELSATKRSFASQNAVTQGVTLARDLVNEPANHLSPKDFADHAKSLVDLGIKVKILDEKAMARLGMNALLSVGDGSVNPCYLAIMEWSGGKAKDKPLGLVGKGVVFDTGGISIKPSGGMEDMKGDMGGAAAVIGTMKTLATRKAKANVVGILGLVENMPDGKATRPGDVVTSMSGQTIEIINTDAEGRLVLCDALWYMQQTYKPDVVINLATLTGAIMVALGHAYAGMFANDDTLALALSKAGEASGDKVWRMPLGSEYDKLINSRFADMKNVGGRFAGSITAAQFLARFIKDTKWAHLDIAGTAFGATSTDINRSWGSGFGVALLDQYVRDTLES